MRGYDSGNRSGNRRWGSLRSTYPTGCLTFESESPSPRPAVAGVLCQVAVLALFADIVLLVIAMAPGGVDGNFGRAAGTLVALVLFGNRRDGFGPRLRHQFLHLARAPHARGDGRAHG